MTEHRVNLAQLAKDRDGHSVFSPSGSPLWLTCSGGLIPNLLALDTSGLDAAYGTVAHSVGEQWLKTGKKPRHLIGTTDWVLNGGKIYEIDIDHDMVDYVQEYVDYCFPLPGDHFVEQRVFFSRLTPLPNQSGTADHVACSPGLMVITDLKMGKGIRVYAKNNSQALLYALGTYYRRDIDYDFEKIVVRIAQPRLNHFDEWELTVAELLEFAEYVRVRAHAAWQLDAPRTASDKGCQWCKVKADCSAFAVMQQQLTAGAFDAVGEEVTVTDVMALKDDIDFGLLPKPVDPMRLTTEQMAFLLKYRKPVEAWWKAMAAELMRRSNAGEDVPEWKLVEGRSNRKFKSEVVAGRTLISLGLKPDDVFEKKLVTPSQAETLLKRLKDKPKNLPTVMASLVFKPPGKPTLVPAHDKRPTIADLSADAFTNTDEDENEEE